MDLSNPSFAQYHDFHSKSNKLNEAIQSSKAKPGARVSSTKRGDKMDIEIKFQKTFDYGLYVNTLGNIINEILFLLEFTI